jgi:hypothetical protein
VEACLLALGPLTVANSPQQRVCMQLSRGKENHHNSVRPILCSCWYSPLRP